MTNNQRGILLMILAMGAFAVEDALIKLIAPRLPLGQIILVLGLVGLAFFTLLARSRGESLLMPGFFSAPVIGRNLGEIIGTAGFIQAIALVPLTTATAIFQAMPLAITCGAALFLRERVGWRRWSAILVGFLGVLTVVRPGMDAFDPNALWAVLAVLGLGARDLFTRVVAARVPTIVVAGWGFVAVIALGVGMLAFSGGAVIPKGHDPVILAAAALTGIVAYWALTAAMRVGDVAAVMPFRYSRLLFALLLGAVVFGERPDLWVWVGIMLIIGSGLYAVARERALSKAATTG